jgi:hypothetical protein
MKVWLVHVTITATKNSNFITFYNLNMWQLEISNYLDDGQ